MKKPESENEEWLRELTAGMTAEELLDMAGILERYAKTARQWAASACMQPWQMPKARL